MTLFRRIFVMMLAVGLVASACGSDAEEVTEEVEEATEAVEETAEEVTEEAVEEATEPAEEETTDTTEAEAMAEEEAAPAGDGIAVDLDEWFIDMPTELPAGTLTFNVSNSGEFPHALAVAVGTSYEDLPQLDNGAIDTDAIGADYLGTTDNFDGGATTTIDFDLAAGDYVFFCPIQFGPNSHAAAGQVISVSVG